jgi:hypothetical protein
MAESAKIKINTTLIALDGSKETRSKMEDFRTVRARVFARLKALDEASADSFLIPGVNAYNQGDYEAALGHFLRSLAQVPAFEDEIRPHIRICERVARTVPSSEDNKYREAVSKWDRLPFFLKWFRKSPQLRLRCKYCGHFTTYIDPNEFENRALSLCVRGHKML